VGGRNGKQRGWMGAGGLQSFLLLTAVYLSSPRGIYKAVEGWDIY